MILWLLLPKRGEKKKKITGLFQLFLVSLGVLCQNLHYQNRYKPSVSQVGLTDRAGGHHCSSASAATARATAAAPCPHSSCPMPLPCLTVPVALASCRHLLCLYTRRNVTHLNLLRHSVSLFWHDVILVIIIKLIRLQVLYFLIIFVHLFIASVAIKHTKVTT